MADPNRALFEEVVELLAPVLDELVFVGGCTTGFFITDPAATGVRPTKDVDAIVEVIPYAKYTALAERLPALGLVEDTLKGAPLSRWRHGRVIVDVMPTDAACSDSATGGTRMPLKRPRPSESPDTRADRDAGTFHRHEAGGISRTRWR